MVASSGPGTFTGRLAHLRIYDGALTVLEIKRDMADDEAALTSFVRTHPLDFAFVNADMQPVLFIDEAPAVQAMTLQLTNTSRTDLELVPISALSSSTFHFALRLRKGTLAAGITPQISTADWALLAEADGTALYLQWKVPKPIAAGASVSLRLEGLNADGADGTHGTRVELDYQNLRYAGQTAELSGTRLQFLDIVNHRGRRDIPLDLRLVDGDRVLSDGNTGCPLRLHLTNTMHDGPGIPLRATKPVSTFVVSFDVQDEGTDRPWALTTAGNSADVSLRVTTGDWNVVPQTLSQRKLWTLTPVADTVLPPDRFIELFLEEVRGLAAAGHAPIVVDYIDIPGYANGTLTVPVERTPLLNTERAVAIGTVPDPTAASVPRLQISSTGLHVELRREAAAGGGGNVMFLELFQDTTTGTAVTYPSIRFHHGNKFWHRIEARPEGFLFKEGNLAYDGLIDIHANNARVSAVQSPGEQPLTINATANPVRIGAASAGDGKLSVSATAAVPRLPRSRSVRAAPFPPPNWPKTWPARWTCRRTSSPQPISPSK